MDVRKFESTFRFLASRILKLHIDNSYMELSDSLDNYKTVDVSHNISEIVEQENDYLGIVELTIKVNISNAEDIASDSYILEMCIEGGFTAEKSMPKKEFEQMLHINGTAALYSIARGFIISTSSQTVLSGQVVLPLLNFTK